MGPHTPIPLSETGVTSTYGIWQETSSCFTADAATGRNVLDLLLEKVNSESGEGFAEFFFDDPDAPFDRVAIPGIGHVGTFIQDRPRRAKARWWSTCDPRWCGV